MDLDTLLHDTTGVTDPGAATLARARAVLDEEVRRTSAPARRLRRPLVAALVAGAASVALVVGPTLDVGGVSPTVSAEAAQVLLAAGRAAGEQPGGWPDAAYWYSRSKGPDGAVREIWIGHHRPGVLRDGRVDAGVLPLEVATFPTGGTTVDWDGLYALPTEAGALERRLRDGIRGAGPDDDTELFVIVGDLLRESPAPPALRRALWEVAARVPGVELLGPARDAEGRPGVAVRRHDHTYLLDPDDGRLLEESSGDVGAPPVVERDAAGEVLRTRDVGHRATYLEQGPADTAPAPTSRS